MKLGLIGHGKMGQKIERLARQQGHHIARVFTKNDPLEPGRDLTGIDMLIDFSVPGAVPQNIEVAAQAKLNLVEGTTGWYEDLDKIKKLVQRSEIGFLYAPNFSLGVHLFLKLVGFAGELFNRFADYDLWVHEAHHNQKLDSPSGTALALGKILLQKIERKQELLAERPTAKIAPQQLQISVTRAGSVPGTHSVGFDSPADSIELTHRARNRSGFALGALAAAEWLRNKKGFFTMDDFLNELLTPPRRDR